MANYDDSNIKHLSAMEHIRRRIGMYIGRAGNGSDYDDGIYVLMKEVIDNSIDEFIMGNGKRIEISLDWNSLGFLMILYGNTIALFHQDNPL